MRFCKWSAVWLLLVTLAVTSAGTTGAGQQQEDKVHISVDMEGVAGVVTGEQLGPPGLGTGRFGNS